MWTIEVFISLVVYLDRVENVVKRTCTGYFISMVVICLTLFNWLFVKSSRVNLTWLNYISSSNKQKKKKLLFEKNIYILLKMLRSVGCCLFVLLPLLVNGKVLIDVSDFKNSVQSVDLQKELGGFFYYSFIKGHWRFLYFSEQF